MCFFLQSENKGWMKLKIWTLLENTACRGDLTAEHGLSLYIETGERKILFDMGQTAAFSANAEKMGVDLAAVDTAILSHGHYDHGGGIATFLRCNDHAPLYISRHAFQLHYNATGKYIGLDPALRENPRLIFTEEECRLGEGLCLYSCNGWAQPWQTDPSGLQTEQDGLFRPEDFRHEQYLLVEEQGKRILISGCSHKGIRNLVHWFQPDVLVGGFHLKSMDPDDPEIRTIGQTLMSYPTVYYTGHCTGQAQYERLQSIMGDRLQKISTGTVLEI